MHGSAKKVQFLEQPLETGLKNESIPKNTLNENVQLYSRNKHIYSLVQNTVLGSTAN